MGNCCVTGDIPSVGEDLGETKKNKPKTQNLLES